MPALYSITTRASGTILTAAIYNSDHQNHVTNGDAQHLGSFSQSITQMQSQTSPGDLGSEVLAASIADELARLRFIIASMREQNVWYAGQGGSCFGRRDYLNNGTMNTWQRMGALGATASLSSGVVGYGPDRWSIQSNNCVVTIGHDPTGANLMDPRLADALAVTRTSGSAAQIIVVEQTLFNTQLNDLATRTVSLRAMLIAGAGFSPISGTVGVAIRSGTGPVNTRRGFVGFTGEIALGAVNINLVPGIPTMVGIDNITFPDGITQGCVQFFWNPTGAVLANDTLTIGAVQLHDGPTHLSVPLDVVAQDFEHQKDILKRFYWHSFNYGSIPGNNIGYEGIPGIQVVAAGNGQNFPFFIAGGPASIHARINTYNPFNTNSLARNINTGTDCANTSATLFNDQHGVYTCTTVGGSIPGHRMTLHISVDGGPF